MEKTLKRPLQQRSQQRMEKALDSAKILLETMPIEQISIPEIAKHSAVPRSSIYQFFPTIGSLLNELSYRHMLQLLDYLQTNLPAYVELGILDILKDLIYQTSNFYNQNHVASLLILSGATSAENFHAQQNTINHIIQNIILVLKMSKQSLEIPENDPTIEHLVEITFSLMKKSYFKDSTISTSVQNDIFDICSSYLVYKGYVRHHHNSQMN